jgi:uncharacterized RDD family membrane protein YckC
MSNTEMPFEIKGIRDSLYAGFWTRLGAMFLDILFLMPIILIMYYLNSLSVNMYIYTIVPNLLFGLWYNIYLVKKYGGTPGKLVAGIKIIRIDGADIEWKEAILRHIVLFALTIFCSVMMIYCLLKADETTYMNLGWLGQAKYLMSLSPGFFLLYSWISNIWIYSEFIVLLTNKRKRAIHDYIAGTVIVRSKYLGEIRAAMKGEE